MLVGVYVSSVSMIERMDLGKWFIVFVIDLRIVTLYITSIAKKIWCA